MWQNNIAPNERVAIYGNNSDSYLNALQILWQKGGVAVLCSMRDPILVVDAWLDFIDCHKVIVLESAAHPFISHHAQIFFHEEKKLLPAFHFHPSAGTILRTSGSSSKPKSVFHTVAQHVANATGVIDVLHVNQRSRWLLSLPLYHVGGLSIAIRCWLAKANIVVPLAHFAIPESVYEAKITHVSLVSTQLIRLLDEQENVAILQKLKAIVLGGSAISPVLLAQIQAFDLPVVRTYGMTEMASQISATLLGGREGNLNSSGQLLPEREIKISENQEIWVRGPMLFSGYVEGAEILSATDRDGWFHTGDRGFIDEDQALHILGRLDNMFISGGENIYPESIEKEILSYPGIEEVIVVAKPHHEYGQSPVAFIKLRPHGHLNQDLLIAYLEKRLAKFKIPRQFLPWPRDVPSSGVKLIRRWF
jgi:o-succinylbenzoate---CoA ligase